MTPSKPDRDASTRSPFAGCAIFIAAFAVMVFLIGFSTLTLFRQFREIAKFTDEKPLPIDVIDKDVGSSVAARRQVVECAGKF